MSAKAPVFGSPEPRANAAAGVEVNHWAYVGRVSVRVFIRDKRVSLVYRCRASVAVHGQGQDGRRVSVRHTLGPTRLWRRKARVAQRAAGQGCEWRDQHH